MLKFPIYLDNNSTTRVAPEVLESMLPYFSDEYGNPGSSGHLFGRKAHAAVEFSREIIARYLQTEPSKIIFTSGTTEANNLLTKSIDYDPEKNEIVVSEIEHPSVLNPVRQLAQKGFVIRYAPVDHTGRVKLDALAELVSRKTAFISIMHANNEIGTIQDLSQICKIAAQNDVLIHTDAAQSIGKIDFNFKQYPVNFVTFGAHKFYGPKGIGVLALSHQTERRFINPMISGGGQEFGLRSGTLNVPSIVGVGRAVTLASEFLSSDYEKIQGMTAKLLECFLKFGDKITLNGSPDFRIPGNLNLLLKGVSNAQLLKNAQDICFSTGSACSTGSAEPSYVLKAIGLTSDDARNSIRLGLGRYNTPEEIEFVCERFSKIINELLY